MHVQEYLNVINSILYDWFNTMWEDRSVIRENRKVILLAEMVFLSYQSAYKTEYQNEKMISAHN